MSYKKVTTERDKIKLMTYIQYIQQCYKEKKQNHNKKINVCQLRNTSPVSEKPFYTSNGWGVRQSK